MVGFGKNMASQSIRVDADAGGDPCKSVARCPRPIWPAAANQLQSSKGSHDLLLFTCAADGQSTQRGAREALFLFPFFNL